MPPIARLGQRLALDADTLTPRRERLEPCGTVERRRGEAERVVRISLTASGQARHAKAPAAAARQAPLR